MSSRNSSRSRFFALTAIILSLVAFFAWRTNFSTRLGITSTEAESTIDRTIVITPNPRLQEESTSQPTPDGTKRLVMKIKRTANGSSSYTFTTTNSSGDEEKLLYSTILTAPETLSIPFNTWSPDNKYVIIEKNDGDVLLFDTTSSEMAPGEQYWDIGELFTASNQKNTYLETTGWASNTLLIINTLAPDGSKGSSYWFEVPSKAVMQLAEQY